MARRESTVLLDRMHDLFWRCSGGTRAAQVRELSSAVSLSRIPLSWRVKDRLGASCPVGRGEGVSRCLGATSWPCWRGSHPVAVMMATHACSKMCSLSAVGHGDEDLPSARPACSLHILQSTYLSCPSMALVHSLSAGPENRRNSYGRARQIGVPLQVL